MVMDKPGIRTTEFWLALLFVMLDALGRSGVFPEQSPTMKIISASAAALAVLGYGAGRTIAKTAAARAGGGS